MITMILRGVIVATSLDRRMGRTTKKPLKCFPSNAKPNHRVVDNRCSDVLVLARGSNGRLNNCLAVELHTQKEPFNIAYKKDQSVNVLKSPQISFASTLGRRRSLIKSFLRQNHNSKPYNNPLTKPGKGKHHSIQIQHYNFSLLQQQL